MSWNHSPIFLSVPLTMQMIKHNKKVITETQDEVKHLQEFAAYLWSKCDPKHESSYINYQYLNQTKDEIRYLKKQLKMLAEMQYHLKYSIR